jgi:adenosine deaminase
MSDSMRAFIEGMPKCELHVHLEGTLEPELKFALARRNDLSLPYASADEMRAAYEFDDLSSFLAVYYEGMGVLLKEVDFYDLTYAYFAKAHSQNVRYAEVFFDPQAHTSRGVAFEVVINGIRRAQDAAREAFGLESALIMCFLRDMSADSAMQTLEQALPWRDWIIGVGLDSDERDNPPAKFAGVFERARTEGFLRTIHCDVDQQDSLAHIWQTLDIGVDRIDHGVNCLEDSALVDEIKKRGLALTVCPISNRYVAADLKAKQIAKMLDLGLKVTVNSDDPAYFPGYMNENLIATQQAVNLSREQMLQLAVNAIEGSWLSQDERAPYLAELNAYAAS